MRNRRDEDQWHDGQDQWTSSAEGQISFEPNLQDGGRANQLRSACTCDACVRPTRVKRPTPVEAIRSTEAT
eukprot:9777303-Heterocapsa_arctica.AAC.1